MISAKITDKMRNLRDGYSSALIKLGYENENVVVLDADLALSTKTKRFGTIFPDRFFDCGISEANMMGMAAGLATCGKIAFASSFAVFATGRCYDQIRQSVAYPELNVKIVATHAGISVGGDGASHQMIEDMALMRALPNMRVIAPADAIEVEDVIPAIASIPGPFYVRMGRADAPVIFSRHNRFRVGKAKLLRKGDDVAIISTGTMTAEALKAYDLLKKEGIGARVIHMPTVKPVDRKEVMKAARDTGAIVTCEEHTVIGGLGGAVSRAMSEDPVPMIRIGINDTFGESGEAAELVKKYGEGEKVTKLLICISNFTKDK